MFRQLSIFVLALPAALGSLALATAAEPDKTSDATQGVPRLSKECSTWTWARA